MTAAAGGSNGPDRARHIVGTIAAPLFARCSLAVPGLNQAGCGQAVLTAAGDDRAEQLRTLHAVIVCSLTTLLVFALLGLSSIPVLRAIGVTVTLGVLFNFVLGLLVARQPATREERAHG